MIHKFEVLFGSDKNFVRCHNCGNSEEMLHLVDGPEHVLDSRTFRIDACRRCGTATLTKLRGEHTPIVIELPEYWQSYVEYDLPY